MYHSISFAVISDTSDSSDYKNTWDDWHLVPTSRPVINPPTQKTTYIEVPGKSGALDMSEYLTGYPVYNNREGSFEFIVMNGYEEWQELYSEIMDFMHGKECHIILEDDPDYYYKGRVAINNWKSNSDGTWSNITIDYSIEPYKIMNNVSRNTYTVSGTTSIDIGSLLGTMPTYIYGVVSSDDGNGMTLSYNYTSGGKNMTETIELEDGDYSTKKYALLYRGDVDDFTITVTGEGSITILSTYGRL